MIKIYLFLIFGFIQVSLFAQTVDVFTPIKDNTIYQDAENSNAKGENFFAGNTNNGVGSARRALIKFDVSSIPAGAVISAATLSLYCNKTSSGTGARNFNLHKLNADWGEGTSNAGSSNDGSGITATANDATWVCRFANGSGGCTNSWTSNGGDFTNIASASKSVNQAGVSYSWTSAQMATDIQNWLTTPATNFGWVLIGDEAATVSAKRFGARENATTQQRPTLTVTYTMPTVCPGISTWTGSVDTAWETPGNWTCGVVPDASTAVIINSGTVIVHSNAICKTIHINPAVVFTVNNGVNFTVVE